MVPMISIPALPAEVARVISAHLRLTDESLPGQITGLYLVGSLALDDYQPGQSDIDFVAVTDTTLTPVQLARLGQLHNRLRRAMPEPKLDGVYVTGYRNVFARRRDTLAFVEQVISDATPS